jgi:hypothetical protein
MASDDSKKKNGRGGSRKHPEDCTCGNCPKVGRKKVERPTNSSVAGNVLAKAKAEQLWLTLIEIERNRLGIGEDGKLLPPPKKDPTKPEDPAKAKNDTISGPDYPGRFSTIPLTNILRYLEDRHLGRPRETSTVNHVHDKPMDLNVTLSVSEKLQRAMEKAEKRLVRR